MTLIELTELLGNLGNFLGSIAVIVTLIYLTIQVRQINRNSEMAALQATRSERIAAGRSQRDSPWLAHIEVKLRHGEPLDEVEATRFTNHIASSFSLLYLEWATMDMGLLARYPVSHEGIFKWMAGIPEISAWWHRNAKGIYPENFRSYVETGMAEARVRLAAAEAPSPAADVGVET